MCWKIWTFLSVSSDNVDILGRRVNDAKMIVESKEARSDVQSDFGSQWMPKILYAFISNNEHPPLSAVLLLIRPLCLYEGYSNQL